MRWIKMLLIFFSIYSYVYGGVETLSIPYGCRAISMGGAYTGIAEGASALYWNPAGISLSKSIEGTLEYYKNFVETTYFFGAGIYPLKESAIGIHFLSMSLPEINNVSDEPPIKVGDMLLEFGYSKVLKNRFYLGATGKYISSRIGDNKASGIAFDIGFIYNSLPVRFGFVMKNIGTGLKFYKENDAFPMEIRAGIGITLYDSIENVLLGDIDIVYNSSFNTSIASGIEYLIYDLVYLRIGYNSADRWNKFSLGGGIKYKFKKYGIRINYAFLPGVWEINNQHRIDLTFSYTFSYK